MEADKTLEELQDQSKETEQSNERTIKTSSKLGRILGRAGEWVGAEWWPGEWKGMLVYSEKTPTSGTSSFKQQVGQTIHLVEAYPLSGIFKK